jgi:hypothetical protein
MDELGLRLGGDGRNCSFKCFVLLTAPLFKWAVVVVVVVVNGHGKLGWKIMAN